MTGLIADALKMKTIDEGYRMPKLVTENNWQMIYQNQKDMPKVIDASVFSEKSIDELCSGVPLYSINIDEHWSLTIILRDAIYNSYEIRCKDYDTVITMYSTICIELLYDNRILLLNDSQYNEFKSLETTIDFMGQIQTQNVYNVAFKDWKIKYRFGAYNDFSLEINFQFKADYKSESEYFLSGVVFRLYDLNSSTTSTPNLFFTDYDELISKKESFIFACKNIFEEA